MKQAPGILIVSGSNGRIGYAVIRRSAGHFAQATLLSGGAERGDIVRLEEPTKDAAKP